MKAKAKVIKIQTQVKEENHLNQSQGNIVESDMKIEKAVIFNSSANRDSPFSIGRLQTLNHDLYTL